jgi:ribonucleotide reductase alpha subunit
MSEMRVTKRDGELKVVEFDKILHRLRVLGNEANLKINYTSLAMKVIDQLYDGISTTKIDELSAEQCASMSSTNLDYNVLAGRIVVSNHQKNTTASFSEVMSALYNFKDKAGKHSPLVSDALYELTQTHSVTLDAMCDYSRDYDIDYFGFKTLERAYLMKIDGKSVERPQHMWLRVAIGIHEKNLDRIRETYDYMSRKYFTHATPTLFNAGTPHPQLSSCFLEAMESDSVDGIYNTLKDCALISKWAGGIGLHIHNVRASGSHIRGTNGNSNGIVPMLKVFNNTAKYIDQGGGRRNGSFAIYLEPWHADVELFLQMRKNHGDEELKARDLFYAMWIPDLFMERVKVNGKWTLMCPDECPGLADVYGDDFAALYTKYETEGKGRRSVNARDVWFQILDAQMETGTPYILFKDACNKKSNQKNLGTIKSSNLCVAPETLILTDKGHMTIQDLEGHKVNVWNGEEFSEVTVVKTGTGQELVDVFTDDGAKVTCTPYHKFYIMKDTIKMVTAEELRPGDELLQCSSYPVIDGTDAYCGESIPSHNCPIQTKLEWFNSYCEAEGNTTNGIASSDGKFLRQLQLFLQTCGIGSVINTLTSRAKTSVTLHNLDSSLHRLVLTARPVKILKVEYNNRFDDTYCFTEPKRHMGVFNGILTGQCTEIIQYSDENETAVCNLASIALPPFIKADGTFDYEELHKVTKIVTYNLNRVIDVNYYPIPKTRTSNFRNRPVGLGIQGLSDCFAIMNIAFHSDSAKDINKKVFETMYHAALEQSCDLAVTDGPYDTFQGSPASQGILQFDMWNVDPGSSRYDWAALKERIKVNGLRNSLLLAPMPTASTSQILGYNECIEPFTSNIYSRRTLAGEFIMTNKYLMKDLNALGLWNDKLKNSIIANNGSVQQIESIPQEIRDKYKTVWEIPMKHLIDMSADRGAFICQSQSLNLWLEDPNYNMLTSMHFYSWSKGLKTGIYYLRRRARHHAQKFTIEPEKKQHTEQAEENHECEMCGA